ncbi:MAG: MFS transporter [Acidobacteria bacterium]|nr:MFS transporter [Acidobacteriota bacterium]MBI3486938.1 MFS transporter [Acidobacteriota bacterium]
MATRLGWVSFFNDAASHVLARILPLYLSAVLGAPPTFVGVVEGLAEGLAVFVKSVSGWLSDRSKSRKGYVFSGYALSFMARTFYLLSFSPLLLGVSRVMDRVGKGLRCPPRDAMVADAAASGMAGRAFGVTSRLDAFGAFAGVGLVLALGVGHGPTHAPITTDIFRACTWIAMPLGLVALLLMAFAVPKVARLTPAPRLRWQVPKEIRGFLALVFLFSLANSSDAFLVLRASALGFGVRDILFLFLGFNAVAALLAVPIGKLSDHFGRLPFLASGWGLYALVYAGFGLVHGKASFLIVLLAYGAFYGLTEGVTRAMLADLLPADKRGSGYGALQLSLGVATLIASPLMGFMLLTLGGKAAFLISALIAFSAAVGLAIWSAWRSRVQAMGMGT